MVDKTELVCPSCSTVCTPLSVQCKNCGGRVAEYITMRRRVDELEKDADSLTAEGNWIETVRLYSILLEYRPQHPRYLKGLALGCIEIGQMEYAREIVEGLASRFSNDEEIRTLRQRIEDLMKLKEDGDGYR